MPVKSSLESLGALSPAQPPVPARLHVSAVEPDDTLAARFDHLLVVLPPAKRLADLADVERLPLRLLLERGLKRSGNKLADLAKEPLLATDESGALVCFVVADPAKRRFERLTSLRKAMELLLEEEPKSLALALCGDFGSVDAKRTAAVDAAYVAWVNSAMMPVVKKKDDRTALTDLHVFGSDLEKADFAQALATARGNGLCRWLTALPGNELTAGRYRNRLRQMADEKDWQIDEYDFERLKKMGAGAFCAVAQGSPDETRNDAAIVRLSYKPDAKAVGRIALVGKGICFDTGGHNLKSSDSMLGMHEDMNGSAVALGILTAIAELKLPLAVDAWLALAENQLSPQAYRQNDVITALDGTTIEIIHTDSEGRLVLADALYLASEGKSAKAGKGGPDLILDFATLTYSMIDAVGVRYCGVFASEDRLGELALAAGRLSGERVCLFPMDEDYDDDLESKVADIQQCSEESEADHILAARLLQRFTRRKPWLHMDLSAVSHDDGLGAVSEGLTGFGVAWGLELVKAWLAEKAGKDSGAIA